MTQTTTNTDYESHLKAWAEVLGTRASPKDLKHSMNRCLLNIGEGIVYIGDE